MSLPTWVSFSDAIWGLRNYVSWDDPRTAQDESFTAAAGDSVGYDYAADNFWYPGPAPTDPNAPNPNVIPAAVDPGNGGAPIPSQQSFSVTVSNPLNKPMTEMSVQILNGGKPIDDATAQQLDVYVTPPWQGASEYALAWDGSQPGMGTFVLSPLPPELTASPVVPNGNWAIRVVNHTTGDITPSTIDLQLYQGWTSQQYESLIDSGKPVILYWQGICTSLDDKGNIPEDAIATLGHYSLGVGYYAASADPNAPLQHVEMNTTWGDGRHEWDWSNFALSMTYNSQHTQQVNYWPGYHQVTYDYSWTCMGGIWLNTGNNPQQNNLIQPTGPSAYFSIADQNVGNLSIDIGLGDPADPLWQTSVPAPATQPTGPAIGIDYVDPDCDISGGIDYLMAHPGTPENWYIKVSGGQGVVSGNQATTGWIQDFQIRYNGQRWFTSDRDTVFDDSSSAAVVAHVKSSIFGSISGTVYDDTNGNGVRDTVDTTLSPFATSLPASIQDDGSAAIVPIHDLGGMTGTLTDIKVMLSIAHPQTSDLVVKLRHLIASPSGPIADPAHPDITLLNHIGTGANFTNLVLHDSADSMLSDSASPYTGEFEPGSPLSGLLGMDMSADADSWWELVVQDTVAGPVGQNAQVTGFSIDFTTSIEPGVAGVQVSLSDGETATTDAKGNFRFDGTGPNNYGLPPGQYAITVAPVNYVSSSLDYLTSTLLGENVRNLNFGVYTPVAISGTVFNDKNLNGTLDGGEAGLTGVTVYLDRNSNGRLDWTDENGNGQWDAGEGEQWVVSGANGAFSFPDVAPGSYLLRIVPSYGWNASNISGLPYRADGDQRPRGLQLPGSGDVRTGAAESHQRR